MAAIADRNNLLCKLSYYGVRGIALNCIKSYLSNRKQCIVVNAVKSNLGNISCGILHG